ncbi:4-aminobutyrate aminotransferase [Microvirga sp. M2]|uniref:4-aminobutyrate aminotransferase n=1 Tax=Microvirga sp. M2 TaxID=3073270 RepID=UPI0039C24D8E
MAITKSLAAATSVLTGVLVMSGAALAQSSAYRSTDVAAGQQHRLGVYGNVQKDCTSGPLPTIRVVTPPKHGELNVRSGKLKAGRISRCPKLEAVAQGVFYKAGQAYKGADEVGYEVRTASGKVERHIVRINVKGAAPGEAKPSPDTKSAPDAETDL